MARYPVGTAVPVHYSSRNPQNSFLEIDRFESRLLFSIAGAFALLGLGLVLAQVLRR